MPYVRTYIRRDSTIVQSHYRSFLYHSSTSQYNYIQKNNIIVSKEEDLINSYYIQIGKISNKIIELQSDIEVLVNEIKQLRDDFNKISEDSYEKEYKYLSKSYSSGQLEIKLRHNTKLGGYYGG